MKPIDLICLLIKNSSAKGDIVVDGFGGSGSVMVACEQMGRNARMVEIEPTYCQVIIDRMKKLFPNIEINKIG